MRLLCLLLLLSLFVGCEKKSNTTANESPTQVDSLQMVRDSLDSIAPQRRVGFTGKHMHGTSYGSSDPAKDAHQDVKKIYRLRRNLGRARSRGREAHRKAEEARRQLMNKKSDTLKDTTKE